MINTNEIKNEINTGEVFLLNRNEGNVEAKAQAGYLHQIFY